MGFTAILLICSMPVAPDSCTESSAIDMISTNVASELGCNTGWQEMIARGSLREGVGERVYLKTLCRRNGRLVVTRPPPQLQVDSRR